MNPSFMPTRSPWTAAPLALVLLLAANLLPLRAQAPSLAGSPMAFQGFLADGDGIPLASSAPLNVDVVFRIYDAETGGAVLWSEQQTVTVDKGQYSVLLGNGAAFGNEPRPALSSLFIAGDVARRYVEATLKAIGPNGTDAVVLPRSRLLPSPYASLALYAAQADRLVNASNSPVLQVSGGAVSLSKAEPAATLDVGGNVAFTGLSVEQDVTVGGIASATTWAGGGVIPVGGIILWSGDAVPEGWALCSGQTVSGVQTPDLRGLFVLGAGEAPGLSRRIIGQSGGSETHVLALAELPSHAHRADPPGAWSSTQGQHNHVYETEVGTSVGIANGPHNAGQIGRWIQNLFSSWEGDHRHTLDVPPLNTTASGSGQPAANMPPFYVVAYIMRVL